MFVLINREKMSVIAKNISEAALIYFAYIETSYAATLVCPCNEATDFDCFSDLEIKMLYKSTIALKGVSIAMTSRDFMCRALQNAMTKLPEKDIHVLEAEKQAKFLSEDDDGLYVYVRGADEPDVSTMIEDHPALCTEQDIEYENGLKNLPVLVRPDFADIPKAVIGTTNSYANKTVKPATDYSTVAPLPIKQPWL